MTEVLMPEQRACMLRVLRQAREDRRAELERIRILNRPTELLRQVELELEIECIEKGVNWLWRTQP